MAARRLRRRPTDPVPITQVTGLATGRRRYPALVLLAVLLAAPAAGQTVSGPDQAAQGIPPLPAPSDNSPQYPSNPMPVAVLQGLDKITARIYTFEAPVGQTIGFGTLKVTVRTCRKRPSTSGSRRSPSPCGRSISRPSRRPWGSDSTN